MAGDPEYLTWLRGRPCAVQPCIGRSEAHHSTCAPTFAPGERGAKQLGGRRGKGQKSADYYAFSLCTRHHGQFHGDGELGTGHFRHWKNAERTAWQQEQSATYRAQYERHLADGPPHLRKRKRQSFDPAAAAAAFCKGYELGDQIRLDLERLLTRAAKEAVF